MTKEEEGGRFTTFNSLNQMCSSFALVVCQQIVKTSPFSARKSNSTSVADIIINFGQHTQSTFILEGSSAFIDSHWQRFLFY